MLEWNPFNWKRKEKWRGLIKITRLFGVGGDEDTLDPTDGGMSVLNRDVFRWPAVGWREEGGRFRIKMSKITKVERLILLGSVKIGTNYVRWVQCLTAGWYRRWWSGGIVVEHHHLSNGLSRPSYKKEGTQWKAVKWREPETLASLPCRRHASQRTILALFTIASKSRSRTWMPLCLCRSDCVAFASWMNNWTRSISSSICVEMRNKKQNN